MNDVDYDQMNMSTTEDATDKKCPQCAGTVVYDPETRGMLCPFCGYKKTLPAPDAEQVIQEMDFNTAVSKESFDWGTKKKTVVCQNCAGTSIYDALETAAVCPFCGSTSVMPAAEEDSIAPGGVCPFEIPLNKAGGLFKKWLNGKIFTPRAAKLQANPEAFKGIYLPYWTFDSMTTSPFIGKAGYDRRVKRGDSYVTETTWKNVSGVYQEFIDDQLVVATKRNEDSGVKKAEPFDFSKMVPYRPELVAGFIAERYSIGLNDGWKTAQSLIRDRLHHKIESYIRSNWRADHAAGVQFSTEFDKITYKYILIPVWISSFLYKGKSFQFVVNGQTGKVGGKAPVSPLRVAIAIFLALVLIALFMYFSR